MNNIDAKIVAHSKNERGDELISFELVMPRIILPEILTHRMFSRNTSSSRAIPFNKMLKEVKLRPFIPIAWQKAHKGMQGKEYEEDEVIIAKNVQKWIIARDKACQAADEIHNFGATKQLCNRILEPFSWVKMLVTTSSPGLWNFFDLRCPKYQTPVSRTIEPQYSWKQLMENHSNPDNLEILEEHENNVIFKLQHNLSQAEIHIQALAEIMFDAYNESNPEELKPNEWHIPYKSKVLPILENSGYANHDGKHFQDILIKVATAMAARVSYTTIGDNKELDVASMLSLHDRLITERHDSPLEHCARCLDEEEYSLYSKGRYDSKEYEEGWVDNFKGFQSYRNLIKANKKL